MIEKKETMVRYTPLPTDEQVPPTPLGRCPKLTRYKLLAGVTICAIAALAAYSTLIRGGGLEGNLLPDHPGASTGCSLNFDTSEDQDENDSDTDVGTFSDGSQDGYRLDEFDQGNLLSKGEEIHPLGSRRHMKKRLPSAIVIGARKAGTRALLRFMNMHPDVVTSKREPHFFDTYYDEGLDWYRQRMPYSYENQITVEKTPNYFVDRDVPDRIYNFNSTIKLILIVRNPIDRAVSDYLQLKEKFYKNGQTSYYGTFEQLAFDEHTGEVNKAYAPIKRSLYCRHLEKWLTRFSISQILIVDGENIKVKPWEELSKVEDFLGLSHKVGRDHFVYNETKGFFCIKIERSGKRLPAADESSPDYIPPAERCLSDSKGRNHPVLNQRARRKLRDFFEPFNNRFFTRIGRTFYWT